jgi:putative endonuclease
MAAKDDLGRRGEALAAEHLRGKGFSILDRNWRCSQGELDIVARDGRDLVFIEVKARTSLGYGHPFAALTARKLARLRRLAAAWCEAHPTCHGNVRIDAVAVIGAGEEPGIEHLERIF